MAEARVLSHTNPLCGGQSDTETTSSPSTCVLPCHYHSTNAPYPSRPSILLNKRTRGRGLRTFKQKMYFYTLPVFKLSASNKMLLHIWNFFFFFLLKSCSILSGCRAILGSRIYQFYCIYIMLVWRRFWISKLHYRITEVCLIFVPKGTSIHSFYGWGSTYVVSSCRRFYRITSLLSPLRLILLSVSTGVMLSP